MEKAVNRIFFTSKRAPIHDKIRRKSHDAGYSSRVYTYVRDAGHHSLEKLHEKKQQPAPFCLKITKNFYHKYGLKHLVLILILLIYCCFGALVFVLIEEPFQEWRKENWRIEIAANRSIFVRQLMRGVFNNSRFLIFIRDRTSRDVSAFLKYEMSKYETKLDIKYSEMKIQWDYWNAMLYCGTIVTTIGYGHIYPHTPAGKIITMIYAIFGIPLILLILQDLGTLLTVSLKFPWFQFKRGLRRLLRYCTKQSTKQIRKLEQQEREDLHVFDLPIPVAIGLVVAWIFLCSATFCIWETEWSYLEAFYFFFISLSTIGLGDLELMEPKMLLMMFGMIFVGLSLVSMCVNLLQTHFEATYETGNENYIPGSGNTSRRTSELSSQTQSHSHRGVVATVVDPVGMIRRTILGVFSATDQQDQSPVGLHDHEHRSHYHLKTVTTSTQTDLMNPSPNKAEIMSEDDHLMGTGSCEYCISDADNAKSEEDDSITVAKEDSESEDAKFSPVKKVALAISKELLVTTASGFDRNDNDMVQL